MKQKTKHLSKATMSILLALVLVVSTLAVGIVSTSAAYLNGKPNTEANAADVAGDKAADVEDAAVGAKAPEAVGANAGDSLGTIGWYVKDKNNNLLGDNIHDKDFSFNITSTMLDGNDVKIKITDNNGFGYGNNERVGKGGTITASQSSNHCVFLKDANKYSKITLHIVYNGDYHDGQGNRSCSVKWVSGVSTAHTITYGSMTNGGINSSYKPTSASSGDTVTVKTAPDTGYQVSTFTVTDSDSGSVTVSNPSTNTYTFTMPDKNVTVNATFSPASYAVTATHDNCTLTGTGTFEYHSSVTFTVTPTSGYALQTLTVKQGATNVPYTDNLNGTYTFTMPAGAVAITAICANTSGSTTVYFKSATAYVYHPLISVNGGTEQKMEIAKDGNNQPIYLEKGSKDSKVKPKSDTGSLRYAWYKIELTDVDLTSPVSIVIRGQDTYMEATGTFTLSENGSVYLACDNLMEGNTLVNLTSASDAVKDFYDTPLHMVATAAEIAAINGN